MPDRVWVPLEAVCQWWHSLESMLGTNPHPLRAAQPGLQCSHGKRCLWEQCSAPHRASSLLSPDPAPRDFSTHQGVSEGLSNPHRGFLPWRALGVSMPGKGMWAPSCSVMEVVGPWLLPFSCNFCSSTARMLLLQRVQHFLRPGAVRHGWQGWLPSPISASSLLGSPQGQRPVPKVVAAMRPGLSRQQPARLGCSHIPAFLESWGGMSIVLAPYYPTAAPAGKPPPTCL